MQAIGDKIVLANGSSPPLSQAIQAGPYLFLSGKIALRCGAMVGNDVAQQTEIIIDDIAALLDQQGLTLADVVRCTVWLTRAEDFADFNRAYAARFAEPYPARSTVISGLTVPGALIEIEATVFAPQMNG